MFLRGTKIFAKNLRGAKISAESLRGFEIVPNFPWFFFVLKVGLKNFSDNLRGSKILRINWRGFEKFFILPENNPTGYPRLKNPAPKIKRVSISSPDLK